MQTQTGSGREGVDFESYHDSMHGKALYICLVSPKKRAAFHIVPHCIKIYGIRLLSSRRPPTISRFGNYRIVNAEQSNRIPFLACSPQNMFYLINCACLESCLVKIIHIFPVRPCSGDDPLLVFLALKLNSLRDTKISNNHCHNYF